MHTKFTAATTLAAVSVALSVLTGCSSSSPSAGTDPASSGAKSAITDINEWQLAYAKCMRAEGIDMPDPDPNGVMTSTVTDDGTYAAASTTCLEKIGDAPTPPGQKKQSNEEALAEQRAIAACFREHGVDMDDPTDGHVSGIPGDAPEAVITACLGDDALGGTGTSD